LRRPALCLRCRNLATSIRCPTDSVGACALHHDYQSRTSCDRISLAGGRGSPTYFSFLRRADSGLLQDISPPQISDPGHLSSPAGKLIRGHLPTIYRVQRYKVRVWFYGQCLNCPRIAVGQWQGPKAEIGVKFWRGSCQLPFHQLRGLGDRCKLL